MGGRAVGVRGALGAAAAASVRQLLAHVQGRGELAQLEERGNGARQGWRRLLDSRVLDLNLLRSSTTIGDRNTMIDPKSALFIG